MSVVFENKFIQIENEYHNSLSINRWLPGTTDMDDDDYKEMAEKQVTELEKFHPKRWIVNIAKLEYALAPDVQEWADNKMFPRIIKAGVKYMAFIMSPNIFSQISVEQLLEEKNVKTADFEIQHFGSEEDAYKWLLSTKI